MELKKSPKADLESKKGVFTLLGLVVALLAMIGAFSWSQREIEFEELEQDQVIIENEVMEITREEPPKIEQPKVAPPAITEMIEIVNDEIKLENDDNMFDIEFTEDTEVNIEMFDGEEEAVEEDIPVLRAEKMPSFQGGDVNTYRMWVQGKVVYPAIASENNISGRVVCQFTVGKDGKIRDIKILASPDKSLSDECIRIFKASPSWTPGEQRGKPVSVTVLFPIVFTLN